MKESNRKKSLDILGAVMAGNMNKARQINNGTHKGNGCISVFKQQGADREKLLLSCNNGTGILGNIYTRAEAERVAGPAGMLVIIYGNLKKQTNANT